MVLNSEQTETLWSACRSCRIINRLLDEQYFTDEEIKILDEISDFLTPIREIIIIEKPF